MFCRECGRQVSDAATFCDGCGFRFMAVQQEPAAAGVAGGAAAAAASAISKQLRDELTARSHDAWRGIKLFMKSPVGGLPESYALFEEKRAIQIGIFFAVSYVTATLIGTYLVASRSAAVLGVSISFGDLGASQLLKVLVFSFVPFVSLSGAAGLARLIFRGTGGLAGDVYTAGASLLPVGVFALSAGVVGLGNIEVVAVMFLFALTYTVLMLYSGCSRIGRVPEAGAAPAVPFILLLSGWLTKVIVVTLW